MINRYLLYFSNMENGDVILSKPYETYKNAKDDIDNFLLQCSEKLSKKIEFINKDRLKNLKRDKNPSDMLYAVKKENSVNCYIRLTHIGRFYNSYTITKIGSIGINEFSLPIDSISSNLNKNDTISKISITKEQPRTICFLDELKNRINFDNKNIKKDIEISKNSEDENKMKIFTDSLIERKKTLNHIDPPKSPKLFV